MWAGWNWLRWTNGSWSGFLSITEFIFSCNWIRWSWKSGDSWNVVSNVERLSSEGISGSITIDNWFTSMYSIWYWSIFKITDCYTIWCGLLGITEFDIAWEVWSSLGGDSWRAVSNVLWLGGESTSGGITVNDSNCSMWPSWNGSYFEISDSNCCNWS